MDDEELMECPICFLEMKVEMANYADGPLATAVCSECGFSAPVANLQDDEIREKVIDYRLRQLLDQIAQGEKARQLLGLQPLFPGDRSEKLVSLMSSEVPSPINYPTNLNISPLSEEDIELVKEVLNL